MGLIEFQCPCGAPIRVPTSAAGRRGKCIRCGRVLTVPEESSKPIRLTFAERRVGADPRWDQSTPVEPIPSTWTPAVDTAVKTQRAAVNEPDSSSAEHLLPESI